MVNDDSHGVEISIAGGVGEMVRVTTLCLKATLYTQVPHEP